MFLRRSISESDISSTSLIVEAVRTEIVVMMNDETRAVLEDIGILSGTFLNFEKAGVITLSDLASVESVKLEAAGIKSGPRTKILNYQRRLQLSALYSSPSSTSVIVSSSVNDTSTEKARNVEDIYFKGQVIESAQIIYSFVDQISEETTNIKDTSLDIHTDIAENIISSVADEMSRETCKTFDNAPLSVHVPIDEINETAGINRKRDEDSYPAPNQGCIQILETGNLSDEPILFSPIEQIDESASSNDAQNIAEHPVIQAVNIHAEAVPIDTLTFSSEYCQQELEDIFISPKAQNDERRADDDDVLEFKSKSNNPTFDKDFVSESPAQTPNNVRALFARRRRAARSTGNTNAK